MRRCIASWIAAPLVAWALAGARPAAAEPRPDVESVDIHAQLSWSNSPTGPQSDLVPDGTTGLLYVMLLDHVTSYRGGEIELRWAAATNGTACPTHGATVYRSAGGTGCTYLNLGLVSPVVLADEPGHFHVQWTNSQIDSSCEAGAVMALQFDLSGCEGVPAQFALCSLSLVDGTGASVVLPAENLGPSASIAGGGGVNVQCPVIPLAVTALPLFSVIEGDTVRFQVTSRGGVPPVAYSAASVLPAGATLSSDGVFAWPTAGNETQLGTEMVQILATDAAGAVALTWVMITVSTSHLLTFAAIPAQNGYEGQLFRLQLLATSADSTAVLSYALVQPAPAGSYLTFADNAVYFDWTPAYNAAETNDGVWPGIRVTVNDGVVSAAQTFTVTVHDQRPPLNTQPVVSAIEPQGIMEEHAWVLTPVASDAEGDALRWSGDNLPDGCEVDEVSGTIRWTPGHEASAENGGLYDDVTLTADDGFGGFARVAFPITVFDQPPVIEPGSLSCGASGGGLCTHFCTQQVLQVRLQAHDDDDEDLVWSATGLPEWLTLDAESGVLSGQAPVEYFGQQFTATVVATETGTAASSLMPLTFAIDCTPVEPRDVVATVSPPPAFRVLHPVASQQVDMTYTLADRSVVRVEAYDGAGRMVRRILAATLPAGTSALRWNGTATNGERVSAGVYYLRGTAGDVIVRERCVLLR